MKVFIDSNVWLRFVLADNEEIYRQCREFFLRVEEGKIRPYTSTIVLIEIYFVLVSVYKIPPRSAIRDLEKILAARGLTLVEKTNFQKALVLHKKISIKLTDCLIATQMPEKSILISYDRDFKKIEKFPLSTPGEIIEKFT